MNDVIGIDFGTTNSLAAFMDGDRPSLIPNARGARATPSAVALSTKGEVLVGESAKNQALINPENTILAVKRRLGSAEPLGLGSRSFRPPELAAFILAALKADAERYLCREVGRAVITAPAQFSEPERRALLEAGGLAGLEVLRIINEPTAAALARAWSLALPHGPGGSPSLEKGGSEKLILVYDFGGGTFDVTVLRQDGRDCVVLASRGDGRLGGIDLDRELCRRAAAAFKTEYGLDVETDRLLAQQLAEQAERAKIELSERTEASIVLPFVLGSNSAGLVHPIHTLSREEFELLARPYIERSLALTERALAEAGVSAPEIDGLVLSGGSSRIPLVRRLLEERFGLKPEGAVNPEEIVALGAAVGATIYGASDEAGDEGSGIRFRDVVSRTYGVEIDGGSFVPLIGKNSPIPALKSRTFTTVADNQDSVEIHILQGESKQARENLSLGRFLLAGIRPALAGLPRIKVDFTIDESDILYVEARDLDTGASQAISIVDLDRGVVDESAVDLSAKIRVLAERLDGLGSGLRLERGLQAEIEDAIRRARGAAGGETVGELRILKAELEGLVGELLARRAQAPGIAEKGASA